MNQSTQPLDYEYELDLKETTIQFEVEEFSQESLCTIISQVNRRFPREDIEKDHFFRYLLQYFTYELDKGDHKAKHWANMIVVEDKYFSSSYLDDYRSYYTSCYPTLPKHMARIHFFGAEYMEKDQFLSYAILREDEKKWKDIWDSYLGYVTVRPLGGTLFGVSLLEKYPRDNKHRIRHFNSVVPNLRFDVFGKQVTDFQSIGFQPQDTAVGLCATFSIWAALHKLSGLFNAKMMSPYQITLRAGKSHENTKRMFPSSGLDMNQITRALEYANLNVETLAPEVDYDRSEPLTEREIKRTIYAYNKMGIPILLGYNILDNNGHGINLEPNRRNRHLVTIVGFRMKYEEDREEQKKKPKKVKKPKKLKEGEIDYTLYLESDNMYRFFTHNDQLGPFTREDFHTHRIDRKSGPFKRRETEEVCLLRTFQLGDEVNHHLALPETLIIPLDPIIKIKDIDIYKALIAFNGLLKAYAFGDKLEWDVYLDFAVNYKQEFHELGATRENPYLIETKRRILLTSYPKYIWVARLTGISDDGTKRDYLDMIFDASALPNELCLFQINFSTRSIGKRFCEGILRTEPEAKTTNYENTYLSTRHYDFIRKTQEQLELTI